MMSTKRTVKTSTRPAGMQTMGATLYAQIRQAMAELALAPAH